MSELWTQFGMWLLPYKDYAKPTFAILVLVGVGLLALQRRRLERKARELNTVVEKLLSEDDE